MNVITRASVAYNVAMITVDKLPNSIKLISDMLGSIARQGINVDMISQSHPYKGNTSLSFTIPSEALVKAITILNSYKKTYPELQVHIDANNTKLSVYGEKMKDTPGVAAKLFALLADSGVEMNLVTTSEVDISCLISDKDVDKVLELIKKKYNIH